MKAGIEGLKQFPSVEGLPKTDEEIKVSLRSPLVRKIHCFALGPEGTNISQACEQWIERVGIGEKTVVCLCETPEISLEMACQIVAEGELGIFWTCAVYYNLHKLFFENPDTLPFFITEVMLLDEMQLAARKEMAASLGEELPIWWKIASHPSPAPLSPYPTLKASSNAQAAKLCACGEVEACITTESARQIHDLVKLHSFGSPPMVFFGGITTRGAEVIKKAYEYAYEVLLRRSYVYTVD